jgi:hypothetical protein
VLGTASHLAGYLAGTVSRWPSLTESTRARASGGRPVASPVRRALHTRWWHDGCDDMDQLGDATAEDYDGWGGMRTHGHWQAPAESGG